MDRMHGPNAWTSTILLRSHKERVPEGKDSMEIIEQGVMVTVQVMASLPGHMIENNPDCANGFVLDGIPRSLSEAEDVERMLKARQQKLDVVIELSADEALLKSRESGCLIHLLSGRPYHENFNPSPKNT
ncbi:adenylate kinase 1 [Penicillium sp. IBT 35674x]|nr:adenylate kinase 1 [Penicillium sp. IBT 35674x]